MNDLDLGKNLPIYLVALITWLGVFVYLLRIDAMTRALEQQARVAKEQSAEKEDLSA
jgi:hypothetical protein